MWRAIPAEYGQLLFREADKLGLSAVDLVRLAGYTAKKKGDRAESWMRNGKGSVAQAINMRRVLIEKGAAIPPIPVSEDDLTRWSGVGVELYERDRPRFFAELEKLERIVQALRVLEDPELDLRSGSQSQDGSGSSSDSVGATRYGAAHGSEGQEAVGKARTPAARARRPTV